MKWKSATALTLALGFALTGCSQADTGTQVVEKPAVTAEHMSQLPVAERGAEYTGAPAASEDFKHKIAWLKDGLAFTPAYDAPAGTPVALIAEEGRSDFKMTPVIAEQDGWLKVLIPGKNVGATKAESATGVAAWVPTAKMEVKEHTRELVVSSEKREVTVLDAGKPIAAYELESKLQEPDSTGRSGFITIKKSESLPFENCDLETGLSTSLADKKTDFRDFVALTEAKPHAQDSTCNGGAGAAYAATVGTYRLAKWDMGSLWQKVSPGTPITFVK